MGYVPPSPPPALAWPIEFLAHGEPEDCAGCGAPLELRGGACVWCRRPASRAWRHLEESPRLNSEGMIETTTLDSPRRVLITGNGESFIPSGFIVTGSGIDAHVKADVESAWRAAHESPIEARARFERIIEERLSDRPRWPIYLPLAVIAGVAAASFAIMALFPPLLKG